MEIKYSLYADGEVAANCTADGSELGTGVMCSLPRPNFTCEDLERVSVTNVTCTNEDGSARECGEVIVRGSGLEGVLE